MSIENSIRYEVSHDEQRWADEVVDETPELHATVENLLERSEYGDLLQEYYSLVEKQATLEATKSSAELADSEEYADLEREVAEVVANLGNTMGDIGDDDFIATLRELSDVEK